MQGLLAVLAMPPLKNPPSAAAHAARLVTMLSEPASADVGALAARHRGRRRPVRAAGAASPSRAPVVAVSAPRSYGADGPTASRVWNAFLGEIPGPVPGVLRGADAERLPDARLAMALFDAARRYLPRMVNALGEPAAAIELLPLVDPSPDARDPHLYTAAAARVGGDLGAIARDFEAQRALLAQGRGDRDLARRQLAALAGCLVARAAGLLGPQVHEDVARSLDEVAVARRRAPVRRAQTATAAPARRPSSNTG